MNRKENSNGSVIPVKKAVKAPDSKIPLANTFLSGFASLYMAQAAAGKPNIMNGNFPVMKAPAVSATPSRICWKKIC